MSCLIVRIMVKMAKINSLVGMTFLGPNVVLVLVTLFGEIRVKMCIKIFVMLFKNFRPFF